jgi:hypothetical protein
MHNSKQIKALNASIEQYRQHNKRMRDALVQIAGLAFVTRGMNERDCFDSFTEILDCVDTAFQSTEKVNV